MLKIVSAQVSHVTKWSIFCIGYFAWVNVRTSLGKHNFSNKSQTCTKRWNIIKEQQVSFV